MNDDFDNDFDSDTSLGLLAITTITGRSNPLEGLDEETSEIALHVGRTLYEAVKIGSERDFVYALMTLTYLGAGFKGKEKWEMALAAAKFNYRAGRDAIKEECRKAVDDLIADIQS